MTSLVQSEAHFNLQSHGFTTLGHLAYAVGQPGQVIPEAEFNTFCGNHVPGASSADVASVRRLLFEGQTLALQQLRLQLIQESLRRRGLAYTFAQAVSWQAYDTYLTKLFAHLHREPPPGFNRVSVSQIVEADRQVFVRLIEANTKPRKDPSISFLLDAALLPALQSYEVSFSLMHTTGKGSGNSAKSNKRQKTSHGQQQTWGADKGKGKGKKGKKGAKMQPLWAAIPKAIRDLGGVANLPSGEPICFDYSLHGDRCRCKADSCPRKHVCAKCFGDHPLKDHKD